MENMITEDYISFEVAKLLREKGFDESCYQKYDDEGYLSFNHVGYINAEKPTEDFSALAPTHQMVMKWLRKKHIIIVISPEILNIETHCSDWGGEIWWEDNDEEMPETYLTYEDACGAVLKHVLENLN